VSAACHVEQAPHPWIKSLRFGPDSAALAC
jgi:hypothetical protein